MPTERFYKLPENKKRRIADAIVQELQREPFEKLHMTYIAKHAGISRAALYTYFDGKEDMLRFSFEQVKESIREKNRQYLEGNGGDYWDMMRKSLAYQMQICRDDRLYQYIYMYRRLDCRQKGFREEKEEQLKLYRRWIYENCRTPMAKRYTARQFEVFQNVCNDLLAAALQKSIADAEQEADIAEEFDHKLLWLKAGMQRDEDE